METGIVRGTRWTMTQRTIEEACGLDALPAAGALLILWISNFCVYIYLCRNTMFRGNLPQNLQQYAEHHKSKMASAHSTEHIHDLKEGFAFIFDIPPSSAISGTTLLFCQTITVLWRYLQLRSVCDRSRRSTDSLKCRHCP